MFKKIIGLFRFKNSSPRQFKSLVGMEGRALTALQPDGVIAIGFDQYAALSESGIIKKGECVVVVGHQGPKLMVKRQ